MQWELETGGTLGDSQELTPCVYPRSDEERTASGVADAESNDGEEALGTY